MITLPNGKICMNEQEAIQWLLDNYPIPFQCSANYAPNTEIGLGTIVNPTPAKVKVGSIIFFADSKVSTVVGLTASGFICSDKYNDLIDDVTYVANVSINANGHLIITLSDESTIDAGLIKQVSTFAISPSQHLLVFYNDGTSTDLGAIFNGNINIAGNLTADSIIENMSGYSFVPATAPTNITFNYTYAGAVKNGNKLTLVWALEITKTGASDDDCQIGVFVIPSAVADKLYPVKSTWLSMDKLYIADDYNSGVDINAIITKATNQLRGYVYGLNGLTVNKTYYLRYEKTFLLSDNLVA